MAPFEIKYFKNVPYFSINIASYGYTMPMGMVLEGATLFFFITTAWNYGVPERIRTSDPNWSYSKNSFSSNIG